MSQSGESMTPFLKWAGGKRWLTNGMVRPLITGTYYEPFLGSGAMFFHCQPRKAVLSDVNSALVETYQALKTDWKAVEHSLRRHAARHDADYYYDVRESRPRAPHTKAAQFIYLNRTCWNGLYRVNRAGVFNVPVGSKENVLLAGDDFEAISAALKRAELKCRDFEEVIDSAREGDAVFADPPYTVRHKHNGFIKYNETLFSWADQVRLRDVLLRAKERGVVVMSTNADHQSIRELYASGFQIGTLSRFSAIAGAGGTRGQFPELLIM